MPKLDGDLEAVVFADGQTFVNVRDAAVAAVAAGDWIFGWKLASQYRIHTKFCLACGVPLPHATTGTYVMITGIAIRVCVPCRARQLRSY